MIKAIPSNSDKKEASSCNLPLSEWCRPETKPNQQMNSGDGMGGEIFGFFWGGGEGGVKLQVGPIGPGPGPGPIFSFSLKELIFSSLHPSRSLAMKVSALTFTSGLGQNTRGPLSSAPFI